MALLYIKLGPGIGNQASNSNDAGVMVLLVSDLTPVRVRGKKRRLPDTPPSAGKGLQKRKLCHTRLQGQKRFSRLELLPAELIEHIFVECLDFSLPRASPVLASVLSSERLYRGLILLAFWNDPAPENASTALVRRKFRPVRYFPMDISDRQSFQRLVLNCKWCTSERFENQITELVNLSLCRTILIDGAYKSDCGSFPPGLGFVADSTKADAACIISRSINPLDNQGEYDLSRHSSVLVLSFPDKLLRGDPWTNDKIYFLELLRRYFINREDQPVPWTSCVSQDSLQEGILSAILEHNHRALLNLLALGTLCHSYEFGDQPIPYALPEEYFVIASRQAGFAIPILSLLVRAASLSVPSDDPELTEWAIESQERNEPFGRWFVQYLRDIPTFRNRNIEICIVGVRNFFPGYDGLTYSALFGNPEQDFSSEVKNTYPYAPG
ncbi:hypothetical protein LOZ66_000925 [Ophidiomyces ophidiicola]|nr:hypothetical protein LOZ66_000925 [Ophidiomyces ophidiicola]